MSWIKKNITLEAGIKIILIIVAVIVFAISVESKVNGVETVQKKHIKDYEKYRHEVVPNTYMRQDVMEQVFIRLDRIERKIDQQNDN